MPTDHSTRYTKNQKNHALLIKFPDLYQFTGCATLQYNKIIVYLIFKVHFIPLYWIEWKKYLPNNSGVNFAVYINEESLNKKVPSAPFIESFGQIALKKMTLSLSQHCVDWWNSLKDWFACWKKVIYLSCFDDLFPSIWSIDFQIR